MVLPLPILLILLSGQATNSAPTGHVILQVSEGVGKGLSWGSIGLAVLTAFLQGLVTALASMTETSNYWTFRFRLALVEHYWWTFVSVLLFASLGMTAVAFATGNGTEPLSVLILASATFLATVRYTLPAWQFRHFNWIRWLAWTNDSRTTIGEDRSVFCGNEAAWRQLIKDNATALRTEVNDVASDWYGWRLWFAPGIAQDPTDILNVSNANISATINEVDREEWLYDTGESFPRSRSLRWGRGQNFRRRVSRAISAIPRDLLNSNPFTNEGYGGRGLCIALGILGRNKGLAPAKLVFKMERSLSTFMENNSTWRPRPAKVNRAYYRKPLEELFGGPGGLGKDFVDAAVELSLLMLDMPHWAIEEWLHGHFEHQSISVNRFLKTLKNIPTKERQAMLEAHYKSSYVSMIISLNSMNPAMKTPPPKQRNLLARPDIMCVGLLLKARGHPEPSWWNQDNISQRRINEIGFLSHENEWKEPMAKLLGLGGWPVGFENQPSFWGS